MTPADLLEEIRSLMSLQGENVFKVRAFEKAAALVAEFPETELRARAEAGTLTELPGIGTGIAEVLKEFLLTGRSSVVEALRSSLPPGLLELARVPGLGPKKARLLLEELEIRDLRELEYACVENRLSKLKGFGAKLQEKILEGVRFLNATAGRKRIDDAFSEAEGVYAALQGATGMRVSETGALRRRLETLSELEFLVELPDSSAAATRVREAADSALARFRAGKTGLPIRVLFSGASEFGSRLAKTTGTEAHWKALGSPDGVRAPDEESFYRLLKIGVIPPETRETGEEVVLARRGQLEGLLPWDGIQGVFHNHTTRSDGAATLEEMVIAAKQRGFKYIGISDHSQSAYYAQGLKEDGLVAQEREIREVRERHPEIRVFWGIESDILADGSLDYDSKWLKRFDFVIASIHSRFQMDRETMTARVLAAVRNPATRFLGHLTGRLLLGRKGYELDVEKVIAECARHDVAIEINAHPARLDIDWRWGPQLREHGTLVSVNPDAHEIAGLDDVKYGVAVARKALLPRVQVLNSGSVEQVEKWLARK